MLVFSDQVKCMWEVFREESAWEFKKKENIAEPAIFKCLGEKPGLILKISED